MSDAARKSMTGTGGMGVPTTIGITITCLPAGPGWRD